MILENAKPRLKEAIIQANLTKEGQEVPFIYNELLTYDTIISVFDFLFRSGIDFMTRSDQYKFVIIVLPKNY